jgi:hypothetical protein
MADETAAAPDRHASRQYRQMLISRPKTPAREGDRLAHSSCQNYREISAGVLLMYGGRA